MKQFFKYSLLAYAVITCTVSADDGDMRANYAAGIDKPDGKSVVAGAESDNDTDLRARNYIGIGGGIEADGVEYNHTALHIQASMAYLLQPHFQVTLNFGYYPFADNRILGASADSYDIVAIGAGGKINAVSGAIGPNVYLAFSAGIAIPDVSGIKPYVCGGIGAEAPITKNLGIFTQGQYFYINEDLRAVKFLNLSAGIAFSPPL